MSRSQIVRHYFFYTDFRGLLHLQEPGMTSYGPATAIKDAKFLGFFYRNLKPLPQPLQYPQYSCASAFWGETNFLRWARAPVIFHDLQEGQLIYSYNMRVPFRPEKLRLGSEGQLFHEFREGIYGAVSTQLLGELQDKIKYIDQQPIFIDDSHKQYAITPLEI